MLLSLYIRFLSYCSPRRLADFLYRRKFGYSIDWKHPRDLNEWINWLSFKTDTTRWSKLADKYRVRQYVKECGFGDMLVKLYGVWDRADNIDFDALPDRFVLKMNNASGRNIIVPEKSRLDKAATIVQLNKWLKQPYGYTSAEPHYLRIPTRIICEEYLDPTEQSYPSSSLINYMIWCINGEPIGIHCTYSRVHGSMEQEFYDIEWNLCNEILRPTSRLSVVGAGVMWAPKNLKVMLSAARRLAAGFPEVRVDMYEVNGKVYFGEMTFTSAAGRIGWAAPYFLKEMGKRIRFQKKSYSCVIKMKKYLRRIMGEKIYTWMLKVPYAIFRNLIYPLVLILHLADHCNLNCAGCNHYSPLASERFCDMKELERNMQKLTMVQQIFGRIVLLGGEPLLNPDIIQVFRIIRSYMPDVEIRLITNGLLLPKMPADFFDACIKYNILVSITCYPMMYDYKKLETLCYGKGIKWQIQGYRAYGWKLFLLDETAKGSCLNCLSCFQSKCLTLAGSRIYICPQVAYIEDLNKAFGCAFQVRKGDYIEVDKLNAWKLRLFSIRPKPFGRYCALQERREIGWHTSERKKSEWIIEG